MADRNYRLSMQLTADGSQARQEAQRTGRAIEALGRGLRPWTINAYDKAFKGLGGDISRALGLDRIGSDMQSGLGKALSWVKAGFSSLWKAASFAFRGITAGVRLVGSMIKAGLTMPVKLATGAFKALGVAAAAVGAGVYAGLKAIGPAAEMEQYAIQLEVLLKNAGKAKARLAELSKYAKETNYGVKEIMEAGNLMEAFGFYSKRNLELAGDAANAFGKDIREIIYSLNYLATGRGGQAFQSLASIGVTRDKLEPHGVKFSNSGELLTDSKKAFDAVLKYFETEFGGMTKRQSKTWKGATQQLGGAVYEAFADGFKDAVKPLTEFVNDKVIPLVDSIRERLKQINWEKILAAPLKIAGGLVEMIRQITDPKTSEAGMKNAKAFGKQLWEGAKEVLGMVPALGKAFIGDLAKIMEEFIGSGGMGKVLDAAWQVLKTAWELGASLFSTVLTSFSREFQSNFAMLLERANLFGDKPETSKRYMAQLGASKTVAEQFKKDNPEEYKNIRNNIISQMKKEPVKNLWKALNRDDIFQGNLEEWIEAELHNRIAKAVSGRSNYFEMYNQDVARRMGWNDPAGNSFYRPPGQLSAQVGRAIKSFDDIRIPVKFDKTNAVVKEMKESAKGTVSTAAETLRGFDTMGRRRTYLEGLSSDLAGQRQALIDDPQLRALKEKGWKRVKNKDTGEEEWRERSSSNYAKNLGYQQAREDHWRRSAQLRGQIGNIDQQARQAEAAKARESQALIDDPQLRELKEKGWKRVKNKDTGEEEWRERSSSDHAKNLGYQQAREDYRRRSAQLRGQIGNVDQQARQAEAAKAREEQRNIRENMLKENQGASMERNRLQEKMVNDLNETKNLLAGNQLDNKTIITELRKMTDTLAVVLEA